MSATRPPAFDDRFTTPVEASRRGAHRARPKAVTAGLPVLAGLAVVLIVLGGTFFVLHGNGSSPSTSGDLAGASTGSTAKATPKAGTAKTPAAQTQTTPASAPTSPAAQSDGGTTTTSGSTSVDHGINLVVLNSITVQGLAKKVQAKIEPDGWKVQRTGNSTNRNLVTTKIYYGKTSTKVTADALQKDLGYGVVVQDSAVAVKGLVVVLGQDAAA